MRKPVTFDLWVLITDGRELAKVSTTFTTNTTHGKAVAVGTKVPNCIFLSRKIVVRFKVTGYPLNNFTSTTLYLGHFALQM